MLANINLLPPRPPKNMASHLTFLITTLIFIIGLAYFYSQGTLLQDETDDLVLQTEAVVIRTRLLEQELAMLEIARADFSMQANIMDALNQTINTTQLMNTIINQLPPETTVVNYTYTTGASLMIGFLVEESRDAGAFAESLMTIPWVLQAKVESVTLISSNEFQANLAIALDPIALTSWQWEESINEN